MTAITIADIDRVIDQLARAKTIPTSTYRVQFSPDFTFRDAEALVPYLHRLGISHLYASPLQRAVPGSMHGYDICDPRELNPELGTREDFDLLSATLRAHGMGLLLDIVPNHMGITGDSNAWWLDVLENGPASRYAHFFDIDWNPTKPELVNKVLLPVLEDQYGNVLDSGKLSVHFTEGHFELHYGETHLPIAPGTYGEILAPALETLLARLGSEHNDVQELQSILTSLRHLPRRTAQDATALEERHREKEVIKRRLAALHGSSPTVENVLDETLATLNGLPGDPRSFDALEAILSEQAYRLAYWRVAGEEINYRRFFDVNTMAALHNELPDVFAATHGLIFELVAAGQVDSLRVDHPDGLWNPPQYFHALQAEALTRKVSAAVDADDILRETIAERVALWLDGHDTQPLYVVAEKILTEREPLPPDWAVSGTTGYDFMNQVNGVFVNTDNEAAFDQLYADFIGQTLHFETLEYESKQKTMQESLAGEINSLAHQLERLTEANRHYRDFTLNGLRHAIREFMACLAIYRTYITGPYDVSLRDQQFVEAAIAEAQRRSPRVSQTIFYFLRDCLLLRNFSEFEEPERDQLLRWVMRFQQVTGPVMAKSVEDTAFYIYNRLSSLNEVGGQPATFGLSLSAFHQQNAARRQMWPHAQTATSTHDTKRSEDVRARLNVLSEMPDAWAEALSGWAATNARYKAQLPDRLAPDANDEYLLYQALLGIWPDGTVDAETHGSLVERAQAYMAKATREAKVNTSWTYAYTAYDEALSAFIAKILCDRRFMESFEAFVDRVAFYGRLNSLSQTLLKLTSPGVPDTYRGTEGWDFSLVDPDNRRPVDYTRLTTLLGELAAESDCAALADALSTSLGDDRVKLYVTYASLGLRMERADLFRDGDYLALEADGAQGAHVVSFARTRAGQAVITVTPRLVVGLTDGVAQVSLGREVWGDSWLPLPDALPNGAYTNMLTGETLTPQVINGERGLWLADVLARFPVALLATAQA
jgi:(1->4)-alpha-D-glucan 1-alpha-D-glucosylmutase